MCSPIIMLFGPKLSLLFLLGVGGTGLDLENPGDVPCYVDDTGCRLAYVRVNLCELDEKSVSFLFMAKLFID